MIKFSTNQADKNKKYIQRPGAYAIIENDDNLIAVIKVKTMYVLPGGGIENEESPEECLKRECLEEIGAEISVLENFSYGSCYFYSTKFNTDMESLGHFFTCKIEKFLDIATEADHELTWLAAEVASELLFLDNQREAVRIFKKKYV